MVDPHVDFNGFVAETVREQLALQNKSTNPGTPAVQPEPLTLNIGGQSFTYQTKEQLEAALNNFVGAVATKLNEQPQAGQVQPANAEGSFVTGSENGASAWDDAEFVKRMTASPKEGFEYAFNQMLFDGKSDNPVEDLKRALTETELTKRSIAAYQFKESHPEFPGGAKNAEVIDGVRQQLGLPYDFNGLEAAYLIAQQRGMLPNFQQMAQMQAMQQQFAAQQGNPQGQENPFAVPQGGNPYAQGPQGAMDPRAFNGGFGLQGQPGNPYMQAPPFAGRGSNFQGQGQGIDPESLSIEQIEAIFNKAGQQVRRT